MNDSFGNFFEGLLIAAILTLTPLCLPARGARLQVSTDSLPTAYVEEGYRYVAGLHVCHKGKSQGSSRSIGWEGD